MEYKSGGFCLGGFCRGVFCLGVILSYVCILGDFVLGEFCLEGIMLDTPTPCSCAINEFPLVAIMNLKLKPDTNNISV